VARFDFAILWDLGPVLAENLQAILVDLYLPATLPASAFEAEIQTADARKERTERRHHADAGTGLAASFRRFGDSFFARARPPRLPALLKKSLTVSIFHFPFCIASSALSLCVPKNRCAGFTHDGLSHL
jgi:hypothetical protein